MVTTAPLSTETVAKLLQAQGVVLQAEIEALGADLCRWRPGAEEWSVNETLGHMIESERRGFNGRIRRFLAEDNPSIIGWNQVAVARERADASKDVAVLLAEFAALRADSVSLVAGLTPAQLQRRGAHDFVGDISVRDLLHEWVHHDRNHVKQILSVAQEYVWPSMGNCQNFSKPH